MKTIIKENSVNKFIEGKRKEILELRRTGLSYGEIFTELKLEDIEYENGYKVKLTKKAFTSYCSRIFKKCTVKEFITMNEKKIVDLLRQGNGPSKIYEILEIQNKKFTDKESVDKRCWKDRLRKYSEKNVLIKEIHDTVENEENVAVDEAVKELKSKIVLLNKEIELANEKIKKEKEKNAESDRKIIGYEAIKEELEANLKEANQSVEYYRKECNLFKAKMMDKEAEIKKLKNRSLFQRILNI